MKDCFVTRITEMQCPLLLENGPFVLTAFPLPVISKLFSKCMPFVDCLPTPINKPLKYVSSAFDDPFCSQDVVLFVKYCIFHEHANKICLKF